VSCGGSSLSWSTSSRAWRTAGRVGRHRSRRCGADVAAGVFRSGPRADGHGGRRTSKPGRGPQLHVHNAILNRVLRDDPLARENRRMAWRTLDGAGLYAARPAIAERTLAEFLAAPGPAPRRALPGRPAPARPRRPITQHANLTSSFGRLLRPGRLAKYAGRRPILGPTPPTRTRVSACQEPENAKNEETAILAASVWLVTHSKGWTCRSERFC
jgi:hypothetical protein